MQVRYFGLIRTGMAFSVLAGLVLSVTPVAAAAPAQVPRHRPAWRIVKILRNCGDDSMSSVTALSADDAWALGVPNWATGPTCGADVEHWNGTGWRRVPVPRGTGMGLAVSQPLAASSGKDAWIFPEVIGWSSSYQYALHWNGTRWRSSRFRAGVTVNSAVAVSPSQAWAFGLYDNKHGNVVPFTARYDGRSWRRVSLPGEPFATLGPAPGGVWAFGPTLKTASRPVNKQALLLMRWNGRSWHTLRLPRITAPRADDTLGSAYLAASGPSNVWVAYQAGDHRDDAPTVLLHWNHHRWHRVAVRKMVTVLNTAATLEGMSSDGSGGIWLLMEGDINQVWFHYHDRVWTSQAVPSPRGYLSTALGMAWIPGTTSALAVGEADSNTRTIAVIYRYAR